ncbi:MAG: pyridoxamine 5'-phosphate oxidase family protein [Chloroflexi bacterium]|nr:pyridoxamine 5'-phosphate oxidase family protein [Chloroflexota bacterium]MBM3166958.1 pyridoxamine 5'-phosphate oxidase family protein [Chloroflexota bacterium]MBM3182990.1 pyridoxamine 5'-phosphate oxidase family protein [Chloroflexota bacterium]MBM4452929.1 pyridoxamine 5'-phosphate oxidase family protein [Chloroflexota bacterium]
MAKLTDDMKKMVASHQVFVATASLDGVPNIATKGSAQILDDEHLVFYELTGGRTWANLQNNPKLAIAVVDRSTMKGYRFTGQAEFVTEGELYAGAQKLAEMLKIPAPPKAAVKMKVEEIFDLGKGGLKIA